MSQPINLTRQPTDHFVEEVVCPYCKKPMLTVDKMLLDEEKGEERHTFGCFNQKCPSHFRSPIAYEIDSMLCDIFNFNPVPPALGAPVEFIERFLTAYEKRHGPEGKDLALAEVKQR